MKTLAVLSLISLAGVALLAMYPIHSEEDQQFEEFISLYGRNYASESELNFRREVFKANMIEAEELQKLNPNARFGVTIFSDLTAEEMSMRRGYIPLKDDEDEVVEVDTEETDELSDIDWSRKIGRVRDQGD